MIVAYPHTVQYAGKRTRKGRMMITTWRQRGMAIVAMLTGLIIMVGVVFGSANTAYAATLTPADERYHVAFPYNDMEYYVGVAGLDASGNKYYCIEAGKLSDYVIGPTTVLASDENARRGSLTGTATRMPPPMRRSASSCRITSGAIGTSGRDRWRSFKAGTPRSWRRRPGYGINRPARRLRARRWNAPMPRLCAAVPSR